MALWPRPKDHGQDVVVPTHCLYPSNDVVSVYVSGRNDTFAVTDGGGAMRERVPDSGLDIDILPILKASAIPQGLDVSRDGIIYSPRVTGEQLLGTIILVANASKEGAFALLAKRAPLPKRNFRELLSKLIEDEFGKGRLLDVNRQRQVIGASTKTHKFDYEIILPGTKRLLLDTVVPESSSINSVLVANLDVKQADHGGTMQRIVYDDREEWKTSDLSLLSLAANVIPFTKIKPVLTKLSA